jgi:hypothetical protein
MARVIPTNKFANQQILKITQQEKMQKWFKSARAKRYRTIHKAGYKMGMVDNYEISRQ